MNACFKVAAIIALINCAANNASAQCAGYSVDILPGPVCQFESSSAVARAINEAGELCGGYYTCDKSADSAVWLGSGNWNSLTDIAIGTLGFNPQDINIARQMSGTTASVQSPTISLAAFYDFDSDTMINLGTLPGGNWSEANAINESGIICGFSTGIGQPFRAVIWQNGQISALPLPVGPNSRANDISDDGSVCGYMGNSQIFDAHAFIHHVESGITIDIGTPIPNSISSIANGIANTGNVCGIYRLPPPTKGGGTIRRAFFWSKGEAIDLGVLPGHRHSVALALNDSDVVVGHCLTETGDTTPFVWRGGVMTTLNDLIPQELNLEMGIAWDINNAGQIVGQAKRPGPNGNDTVAVRLTPIPSPVGDINCDSVINVNDLLGVINHWTNEKPKGSNALPQGDFTHDGVVNFQDLMIVIDNWS